MQLVQSWRWSCEVLYGIWQPDYVTLLGRVYVAESTRQCKVKEANASLALSQE